MQLLKRLLMAATGSLLLLMVGGYVAFLILSRPEPIPTQLPPIDDSMMNLDRAVGGYLFGAGESALVTYAAGGGLQLIHLGEPLTAEQLTPIDAKRCRVWDRATGQDRGTVTWQAQSDGPAGSLIWVDERGAVRRAWRISLGYQVRELRYQSGDTPLVATWFLPDQPPAAAAVMIHGSGDSDRNNLWYVTIAHHLAANGVAMLLPDKRGCGSSGGQWRTASFDLLANDVVAAVNAVRAGQEIDPADVGLIGISQGGWIAPLAASKIDEPAFVIDLVGTTVPPNDQLLHETQATLAQHHVPRFVRSIMTGIAAEIPRRKRATWWELNGAFDPLPYWRGLEAPALVVYGAEDENDNVPVERSVALLKQVQRPDQDLTIEVYPDSGHGLYTAGTRTIRPDFLQLLTDWITAHGGPPGVTVDATGIR